MLIKTVSMLVVVGTMLIGNCYNVRVVWCMLMVYVKTVTMLELLVYVN